MLLWHVLDARLSSTRTTDPPALSLTPNSNSNRTQTRSGNSAVCAVSTLQHHRRQPPVPSASASLHRAQRMRWRYRRQALQQTGCAAAKVRRCVAALTGQYFWWWQFFFFPLPVAPVSMSPPLPIPIRHRLCLPCWSVPHAALRMRGSVALRAERVRGPASDSHVRSHLRPHFW